LDGGGDHDAGVAEAGGELVLRVDIEAGCGVDGCWFGEPGWRGGSLPGDGLVEVVQPSNRVVNGVFVPGGRPVCGGGNAVEEGLAGGVEVLGAEGVWVSVSGGGHDGGRPLLIELPVEAGDAVVAPLVGLVKGRPGGLLVVEVVEVLAGCGECLNGSFDPGERVASLAGRLAAESAAARESVTDAGAASCC